MTVALIDNGSLEPAAQLNLRKVAEALSKQTGVTVHAVSWKHSDRAPAAQLGGQPAWTLAPWIRAQFARGEREFIFVPFFISAQGAIGSALRSDLEKLSTELGGFSFSFTDGLAARGAIAPIVAARVRETMAAKKLSRPAIVVVDHGGPSPASAALRDEIAHQVRTLLGDEIASLAPASMEGSHPPLLADQVRAPGFADREVIVALLFLSPGRHPGPDGDVAQICRAAHARCHLAGLIGEHATVIATLSAALHDALAVPTEAGRDVS